VDYRYAWLDPAVRTVKERLERLLQIFNQLLMVTDGDVEEALQGLENVGKQLGLLDERLTIEDFRRFLERNRTVTRGAGGGLALTSKGERGIRTTALDLVFSSLGRDLAGEHRIATGGAGAERLPETRPWEFGDPLALLASGETVTNAIRRNGIDQLSIEEADLRVHETESLSSCATVLLIDVSHSMVLYGEDRITPAKRVALALCELITTKYPKDSLDVVLFGDDAWEVPLRELPYLSVGPYHTNTRAGIKLAREILRKKRQTNRQILMLTDGKPSALTEPDGTITKNPFGLDRRIVNKTLEEADNCRRLSIPITTFMLTSDPLLVDFVERFTEVNHGRAYYSQLDRLGSFVLVDYVRNRRRRV
jgi:Ca-activated chloride channel family protein